MEKSLIHFDGITFEGVIKTNNQKGSFHTMATRKTQPEAVEVTEPSAEETTQTAQPEPQVTKVGNLTKDPTLRYGANGQAICEVDLAVNPHPKDEDTETQFYRLVAFRDIAQNMADSLVKSTRVIVQGKPLVEEWEDKETKETRSRKKILVAAIGPDLRYVSVDIHRVYHANPPDAPKVDVTTF